MHYLIGIDIGTSAVKTVLFDTKGRIVALASQEYPMDQPQNGWAEQNPDDWWNATQASLKNLLSGGVEKRLIRGVGLTGQMHGLVMLDDIGKVIRPAILWCDQRTDRECAQITEKIGYERLIELTANPALPAFTASKILWVRSHEPENYKRCRQILLPKDYIRYKLTGVFATEYSDASGTQLLDVVGRRWSQEMLQALEIDPALLPPLYESCAVTGGVSREAALATGLPENAPVVGGAGDNAAAAIGTGVVRDGSAFTTIGTSGVVYAHTSKPVLDPKGRVHTFCSAVPGGWHVMGVTQSAGLSLKWFRDTFCELEIERAKQENKYIYSLTDAMAERSPIGAGKLLFLPYLMGERTPHLDPDCRGVFFGISAIHQKKDFIRAVLEGVTYSLADCMEVFRSMQIDVQTMMVCGGGARSDIWRKMIADVFGCDVATINAKEGPALGAAILAGVGAGVYKDIEQGCESTISVDLRQPFSPENHERYMPYYRLYRQLYAQLKDSYKELAAVE